MGPIVFIILKKSKENFDATNVSGIRAKGNIAIILDQGGKGIPAFGRELPDTKKPIKSSQKHG